ARRAGARLSPRPLLHRLLLGADGAVVRRRRDEFVLDRRTGDSRPHRKGRAIRACYRARRRPRLHRRRRVAAHAKSLNTKHGKAYRMTKGVISALAIVAGLAMTAASDRALAQNGPAGTGTTLITLGTRGGPLPSKDPDQTSTMLAGNGALYLVAAGGGATG